MTKDDVSREDVEESLNEIVAERRLMSFLDEKDFKNAKEYDKNVFSCIRNQGYG